MCQGLCVALALSAAAILGCVGGSGGDGGGGSTTDTGGSGSLPTCDGFPSAGFGVMSFLYKAGLLDEWPFPSEKGIVTGTVTEVGAGPLPESCGLSGKDLPGVWAVIDDADGVSWTACYHAKGAVMPLVVGQEVTAQMERFPGDVEPTSYGLLLESEGQFVLWAVYENNKVERPEGLTLDDGNKLCSSPPDQGCGREEVELVAAAGGSEVTLMEGQVATVGPFEVHVGSWHHFTSDGGCDAGGHRGELFVLAAP